MSFKINNNSPEYKAQTQKAPKYNKEDIATIFAKIKSLPLEKREQLYKEINREIRDEEWNKYTLKEKFDNLEDRISNLSTEDQQKLFDGLKNDFGI